MTTWTARIDALLGSHPCTTLPEIEFVYARMDWALARLSLAAERLREPHGHNCRALWSLTAPDCTCGKDEELKRILEGK